MKLLIPIIAVLMLFPSVSLSAERVVVVLGPYKFISDNERSPEKSKIIAEAVTAAIKDAGDFEPLLVETACENRACLKKTAAENNADDAVMVFVEESGTKYDFKVLTLSVSHESNTFGAFEEAKEKINHLVIKILQQAKDHSSAALGDKPGKATPVKTEEENPTQNDETVISPTTTKKQKRITPKTWTMLGVTGAAAIGFGVVEGIAYVKRSEYEDKEIQTVDEKDRVRAWQWAGRGILFFGSATAVTFIVLLATDLVKSKSKRNISLLPGTDGKDVLLILQGSF